MNLVIGSAILTLTVLLCGQEPTNPSQSSSERNGLTAAHQRAKLESKNEAEFQQAKACIENGLSEIEIAINLSPESETAWSYKTNLLLEASKLAEMEGQTARRVDLKQQASEAQRRTDELSRKQKQNQEADSSTGRSDPPKAKRP